MTSQIQLGDNDSGGPIVPAKREVLHIRNAFRNVPTEHATDCVVPATHTGHLRICMFRLALATESVNLQRW